MIFFRWFYSQTTRQALATHKHYRRLLAAQRDLLPPAAVAAVQLKLNELRAAIQEGHKGRMRIKMEELQFAAEKNIPRYPHAAWRENVEVLLVALAVAMAIRTFFLQPFKIPTGSMQPTLYGVNSTPDFSSQINTVDYFARNNEPLSEQGTGILRAEVARQEQLQKALLIPTGWQRVKEWFQGNSYLHFIAPTNGAVEQILPMHKFLIFNLYQTFVFAGESHTLWFPPDFGESDLRHRAGFFEGRFFRKGEDVLKMRMSAGDHLFVDRLTYNFRQPERGEIVVFETGGIPNLNAMQIMGSEDTNTFYIKRLIGLGGETLTIHQDGVVANVPRIGTASVGQIVVNGKIISASTPHFENLYGFISAHTGETWLYQDNHYFGHGMLEQLAPGSSFQVSSNHLFVMGDNTFNSSDSRYWGDFSEEKVIGKNFFVYWPLTSRFGCALK